MKQFLPILVLCLVITARSQTDFRFDNVAYKTIYPNQLCIFLKENPNTLLLDVRSPGEHRDTSSYNYLNIGHLKNAVNIPIDSIPKNIEALRKQKDRPFIIYCCHSQRSRRVSKLLADSGFTNMLNLNGGMAFMNNADETSFPCKKDMIVYRLNYKTIAASEANKLIKTDKNLVILDVRKPSEFEGKDTIEELNIGRLKKAINLPLEKIKSSPSELDKYKGKTILVYDNYGEESNKAAAIIASRETSNVYNLFGGMSAMMGREKDNRKLINELVEGLPPYKLLSVKETADLLAKNDKLVIIDVRSNEEYNNNGKQRWKNLGRIKEAKNFPSAELEKRLNELENYKNASVLLYGNSAAKCGRLLYEAGFKNVNIVYDGIWGLVSTIKNVDGLQHLQTFLENNEGLY